MLVLVKSDDHVICSPTFTATLEGPTEPEYLTEPKVRKSQDASVEKAPTEDMVPGKLTVMVQLKLAG